MDITIVSLHIGVHGSLLNLLDLMDYLIVKGHKVTFYCLSIEKLIHSIMKTKRTYKLGIIKEIDDFPIVTSGNIITDFKTLCYLEPQMICKKLIILDNAELSHHLNGTIVDFYPEDIGDIRGKLYKHLFDSHIFLMPPVNHVKFVYRYPDLNSTIFYKKINTDVLKTIKTKSNGKIFYRMEDFSDLGSSKNFIVHDRTESICKKFPRAERLDDLTKMFEYDGYVYYRRKERGYWEQFGRLIFEFFLLGKDVLFLDDPCDKSDGLCDYWVHYMGYSTLNYPTCYSISKMKGDYKHEYWLD